ncbi:MAG: DUF1801 domain-containing protein [Acidobacteriota bacterium]|nr:DUF1801 domain-containing protein [Acidobacteriota bacterium]MDH3530787.1 DUF1801 domain-containing protein [Acidobacteriota bacterium]
MAELKTKKNKASEKFLSSIADEAKRNDCIEIEKMMRDATGCAPSMWGDSLVGYGSYHFKYKSGREGDWFRVGFAPRAQNVTIYIMNGFERYGKLMSKLGKHSTGKSCLYIKRLSEVDKRVLRELITESLQYLEDKYGPVE